MQRNIASIVVFTDIREGWHRKNRRHGTKNMKTEGTKSPSTEPQKYFIYGFVMTFMIRLGETNWHATKFQMF
jgi:hypothetical protein